MCVFYYLCVFIKKKHKGSTDSFLLLITAVQSCPGEEGDSGGHVLRETTSRGLCGLVCPSRTSERGGEGDCVKEEGGGEGECERERALERLRCYSPGH